MAAPVIVRAVIDDVIPGTGAYVINYSNAVGSKMQAVALAPPTGINPFGTRTTGLYLPGTHVLCAVFFGGTGDTSGSEALILGAIPPRVLNPELALSDWQFGATSTHAFSDLADTYRLARHGDSLHNYAYGAPLDAIPGHDAGVMQELGIGYGVGYLEAWIRASEMAGISFHYQDTLTRLAAYNFDFWHAGGERWIRNDQGEVSDVDGMTPYPWEALGLYRAGGSAFTQRSDVGAGNFADGPTAVLEFVPKYNDLRGLFRHQITRGYLGDLRRTDVVAPIAPPDATHARLSDGEEHNLTGLLSIQEHRDGLYSVRSAKGIVHEKYIFLPVPRQTALPEESKDAGDTALEGYAPAGVGTPQQPHLRTAPRLADAGRPDMWVAQTMDLHAYMFNWLAVRGFAAHEKDWKLPDEGFFAHKETEAAAAGWFGAVYVPRAALADTYTFSLPEFADVDVDHLTRARYYYSRSCIKQQDDGSILIDDGYGGGLHFAGGNATLTVPGDFLVRTGRSTILWAGDDAVIRAGSSVDVTAALGDVRVKAERNAHVLAGNGGVGGILLESKGTVSSTPEVLANNRGEDVLSAGIVLKLAQGSPLIVRGADVYFRADGDGTNPGNIFLQATGVLSEQAATISRKVDDQTGVLGYVDYVGDTPRQALSATRYYNAASTSAVFSAIKVGVQGDLLVTGTVSAGAGVVPVTNAAAAVTDMIAQSLAWVLSYASDTGVDGFIADARAALLPLAELEFSFRTPAQYGTDIPSFYLAESTWQRMYRQNGLGVQLTEPEVRGTLPYPGKSAWDTASCFRLVDSNLFDWSARRAKDRTDPAYASGTVSTLRPVKLQGNYLVSKQEVSTPP